MPSVVEFDIPTTDLTASPNKSKIIAVNNAQRITLQIQFSASLTAGSWVLKAVPTPDPTIEGAVVATAAFPATPARVTSVTVEGPFKYVYAQQTAAPVGGTMEKAVVYWE